jgi:hypothetical protein
MVASGAQREEEEKMGNGKRALGAALGRKRREEARVFPRIRSGLAKRRRRRFGVGCSVTFAGRSDAWCVLVPGRRQEKGACLLAQNKWAARWLCASGRKGEDMPSWLASFSQNIFPK